jgi:hypothetical protein
MTAVAKLMSCQPKLRSTRQSLPPRALKLALTCKVEHVTIVISQTFPTIS